MPGVANGVSNWTARPDIFPDGIYSVYKNTSWPIVGKTPLAYAAFDHCKMFPPELVPELDIHVCW